MKRSLLALPLLAMTAFGTMAQAAPPYPLTTCVVSGDTLGEMGKPVILNYQGTEVRFCCNGCVKAFKKNPAKYLAKLKAASPK